MRTRKGFTLIELLIAVNLAMFLINLILMSLGVVQYVDAQIGLRQNMNGIIQLRQKLAVCRITDVSKEKITCSLNQNDYVFSFEKERLIMTPGYVVYLEGILEGVFFNKNHVVSIVFSVEGKEINAILAYEK